MRVSSRRCSEPCIVHQLGVPRQRAARNEARASTSLALAEASAAARRNLVRRRLRTPRLLDSPKASFLPSRFRWPTTAVVVEVRHGQPAHPRPVHSDGCDGTTTDPLALRAPQHWLRAAAAKAGRPRSKAVSARPARTQPDGPSIALNPPGTVGPSNRIGADVAGVKQTSRRYTVFVQRRGRSSVRGGRRRRRRPIGAVLRAGQPIGWISRQRACACAGASTRINVLTATSSRLLDALLGGLAQLSAEAFGKSFSGVALSADGNTLAVNASQHLHQCAVRCRSGAVVVYQRGVDGRWTQRGRTLANPPPAPRRFDAHAVRVERRWQHDRRWQCR